MSGGTNANNLLASQGQSRVYASVNVQKLDRGISAGVSIQRLKPGIKTGSLMISTPVLRTKRSPIYQQTFFQQCEFELLLAGFGCIINNPSKGFFFAQGGNEKDFVPSNVLRLMICLEDQSMSTKNCYLCCLCYSDVV